MRYTSRFYLLDALNPKGIQPGFAQVDAALRLYSNSGLELSVIGRNLSDRIVTYLVTDQALLNGGTGTGTPAAVVGDLVGNTEPGRSVALQAAIRF